MAESPGTEARTVEEFCAAPAGETYAALFRLMAPQVVNYFRVRGCSVETAEDLTQDVMLTVYRQIRQLRETKRFRPWMFRIARNTLLQERRKRVLPLDGVDVRSLAGPQTDPLAKAQFEQWMQALDAEEREAVLLRFVEGLEHHEIAEALGIPLGTAQWRVFQSKKKLAARFGPGARK